MLSEIAIPAQRNVESLFSYIVYTDTHNRYHVKSLVNGEVVEFNLPEGSTVLECFNRAIAISSWHRCHTYNQLELIS